MKNFNKIPFFLITGACASGKSFYVKLLKEFYLEKNIKVHDFDEKIKLSLQEGVDYFIDLTIDNWKNDNYTIVCGGITPEDLKKSNKYSQNLKIYGCLLNVSEEERENRLNQRNDYFFEVINKLHNTYLSKEEIIKSIIQGSNQYKNLIKLSDEFIEVDNTSNNNSETLINISNWLNSKIKEIEEN